MTTAKTIALPDLMVPETARIYVSGPMTSHPYLNRPAFRCAAPALRAQGHHVENPAEITTDPNAGWLDCMRADIARLVTCDALYMLPGWEHSRGASLEHDLAQGLGLLVIYSEGMQHRDHSESVKPGVAKDSRTA